MFNIVELLADEDESKLAPCKHGHIVVNHACYCHKDDWRDGPIKCPIYRHYGEDKSKWIKREWETINLPMFKGFDEYGDEIVKIEPRPCMPDDDIGGCPMFEPRDSKA